MVCEIKGITQTLGRWVGLACLSFGLLVFLSPFACFLLACWFASLLPLFACLFLSSIIS
jgi:hypothetical protein